MARLERFLFRQTHGGDFGRSVGAAGYVAVINGGGIEAGDLLHADQSLVGGDVREGGAFHNVADGIDAGAVSAVKVVHHHLAAFDGNAKGIQVECLEVGDYTNGGEDDIALDFCDFTFCILHSDEAAFAGGVHALHGGGGHHLDAVLAEGAFQLFGNLLVFHGDKVGQELHDGDFRAEGGVEMGELAADGAGAHHHHGFRKFRKCERHTVTDDFFTILLDVGQLLGAGAGGEDNVVGFEDLRGVVVLADGHFAVLGQGGEAFDDIDIVLFQQELHALAHLIGDTAAAAHHRLKVGAGGGIQHNAVIFSVFHIVIDLCRFQQSLGGDTAPIEADAAQFATFDDGGFQIQLAGTDGRHVTSGATPDNDDIVFHSCLIFNLL